MRGEGYGCRQIITNRQKRKSYPLQRMHPNHPFQYRPQQRTIHRGKKPKPESLHGRPGAVSRSAFPFHGFLTTNSRLPLDPFHCASFPCSHTGRSTALRFHGSISKTMSASAANHRPPFRPTDPSSQLIPNRPSYRQLTGGGRGCTANSPNPTTPPVTANSTNAPTAAITTTANIPGHYRPPTECLFVFWDIWGVYAPGLSPTPSTPPVGGAMPFSTIR